MLIFTRETRGFSDALGWLGNTKFSCSVDEQGGVYNLHLTFSGRIDTDSQSAITIAGVNSGQITQMAEMLTEVGERLRTVEPKRHSYDTQEAVDGKN